MNHRFAVSSNNSRTRSVGLPATLTHDEWTRTVAFFSGLCAYCAASPAAHLDHFIPVARGGGTTSGNCLPSCAGCNLKKSGKHPDELAGDIVSRLPFLRSYLASVSTGQDTGERTREPNSEVVGVRIPHDVLAPLDARVASLNASGDVPSKVTRAGLILHLVRSAVAEWKRAEKGGGA